VLGYINYAALVEWSRQELARRLARKFDSVFFWIILGHMSGSMVVAIPAIRLGFAAWIDATPA
jgi:hypothetical protein